jgi:hypothetical protein
MADLPSGWIALGEARQWQRLMTSSTPSPRTRFYIVYFAIVLVVIGIGSWVLSAYGPIPAGLIVGAVLLVMVAVAAYVARRSPASEINFDTDEARVGGKTVPFAAITEAVYLPVAHRDRTDSYLGLDTHSAPVLTLCLRSSKIPELTADERMLVAEILRRSNVAIPQSRRGRTNRFYDPAGKYEWMRHPNNLTRDDAIEYVLHTPKSGEAWRTPPPKKSIWIDEG